MGEGLPRQSFLSQGLDAGTAGEERDTMRLNVIQHLIRSNSIAEFLGRDKRQGYALPMLCLGYRLTIHHGRTTQHDS